MTMYSSLFVRRIALFACLLAFGLGLAACGKKRAPSPPGPPEEITYPRSYPNPE